MSAKSFANQRGGGEGRRAEVPEGGSEGDGDEGGKGAGYGGEIIC